MRCMNSRSQAIAQFWKSAGDMRKPDSFFSRIVRDLIWAFLILATALCFVHEHVNCELSDILAAVQWGLCGVVFLLSLATLNVGGMIVAFLVSCLVPAVSH